MTFSNGDSTRVRPPGARKRKSRTAARGRQKDPLAVVEIAELLGERPLRRDLLIEYLHLIQDRYHHISARHLHALAEALFIPMAEAYEVATFYHHFDVVREGEVPPPPITVRVCESLSCAMAGAGQLFHDLEGTLGPDVRVLKAPCMGRCESAPAAKAGFNDIDHATASGVEAAIEAGDLEAKVPDYQDLDSYLAEGGYAVLNEVSGWQTHPR